jgi:hypothetical protein
MAKAQENQTEAEKIKNSRASLPLLESDILSSSKKIDAKSEEKLELAQPEEASHEEQGENGGNFMPDHSNERNSIQFISVPESSKIFDLD